MLNNNSEVWKNSKTQWFQILVIILIDKLNKLEIYKFDYDLSIIQETLYGHISEATYYRLFLDKYLPDNLDYILYVDADIICYRDPIPLIKEEIQKLLK